MSPAARAQHTLAQVLQLVAGDSLSSFEAGLISEISTRRAEFGDEALISEVEAAALAVAIDTMEASIVRVVSAQQAEFAEACRRASAVAGGPW